MACVSVTDRCKCPFHRLKAWDFLA